MRGVVWLRLEALVILAGAILFVWIHPATLPIWLIVLILIAPDIAMAGYAAGPRIGAVCYNLAHTYAAPVLLAILSYVIDHAGSHGIEAAAFWAIHIAADRALGYGLKEPTDFKETHLGRLGQSS
ncbi:DUF4260 domain-containing protein [Aestuariibius insulae]|uniref:DUF4260 domain-containing protein n=1 Tax=Aestuariibius insulae TaxID=2058287 RepID=UPI00345EF575